MILRILTVRALSIPLEAVKRILLVDTALHSDKKFGSAAFSGLHNLGMCLSGQDARSMHFVFSTGHIDRTAGVLIDCEMPVGWMRMALLILYFVPYDLLTPQESFNAVANKLFVSPVVRTLVFTKASRNEVSLLKYQQLGNKRAAKLSPETIQLGPSIRHLSGKCPNLTLLLSNEDYCLRPLCDTADVLIICAIRSAPASANIGIP